jgi:hypothetical protein
MFNVISRIKASRHWVAALDMASKEQFAEALEQIRAMESLLQRGPATNSTAHIHLKLLKAVVCLRLGMWDETAAEIRCLNPIIKEGRSVTNDYLRGYLSILARSAAEDIPKLREDPDIRSLLQFPFQTIDQNAVPADIKRNFPYPSLYRSSTEN